MSMTHSEAYSASKPNTPDRVERILAVAALILLAAVVIAVIKGKAEWSQIPTSIWAHIATICIALILTPIMMLRQRGDKGHRQLGWIWVSALALTALLTFNIRYLNHGQFSFIHLLSAWTLVQVVVIVRSAKAHNVARHRRAVRGMVIGALLIAGFFTFPFNRLMGQWLFS